MVGQFLYAFRSHLIVFAAGVFVGCNGPQMVASFTQPDFPDEPYYAVPE